MNIQDIFKGLICFLMGAGLVGGGYGVSTKLATENIFKPSNIHSNLAQNSGEDFKKYDVYRPNADNNNDDDKYLSLYRGIGKTVGDKRSADSNFQVAKVDGNKNSKKPSQSVIRNTTPSQQKPKAQPVTYSPPKAKSVETSENTLMGIVPGEDLEEPSPSQDVKQPASPSPEENNMETSQDTKVGIVQGDDSKVPTPNQGAKQTKEVQKNIDELILKLSPNEQEIAKTIDFKVTTGSGFPEYIIGVGTISGNYYLYKYGDGFQVVPYNYQALDDSIHNSGDAQMTLQANGQDISSDDIGEDRLYSKTGASASGTQPYGEVKGSGFKYSAQGIAYVNDVLTFSPLIFDINKDGKVDAMNYMGVDLNGDGIPDGAAVNGDKMLAMSDIDGDGKITGVEVFGDRTIDPFTGRPLNGANGFESLRMIALSAQALSNTSDIIDHYGIVDIKKLEFALNRYASKLLGLIGDNNVTVLEPIKDIQKISTYYKEKRDFGNISHLQLGTYIDANGNFNKVDDVWFKLN